MSMAVAFLAMQEPTFLILTALAAEPLHGYGVIRAVEQLSQGEVVLRPGTLYGALDRLAEQGLVELDREEAVDGRLRRYYRLTDSGAAAPTPRTNPLRRDPFRSDRMNRSSAGQERRYRRLLRAYPGPYRRQHAAEIV